MAQRIIGVSKRLIEVAGEEFLKKGFESFTEKLAQLDLDYLQTHLPRVLNNQKNISSDLLKNWGISDSSRKLFFESITYSFYQNLFIPFIKEMHFEDAKDYVIKLTQFYSAGITTMK